MSFVKEEQELSAIALAKAQARRYHVYGAYGDEQKPLTYANRDSVILACEQAQLYSQIGLYSRVVVHDTQADEYIAYEEGKMVQL